MIWVIVGVGDSKEKRYFFSHVYRNVSKRAAGCGYWKSVGKGKQIIASESNQVVGTRKTLVFCEGKCSHETSTQWVMHELRLLGFQTPSYPLFQVKNKTSHKLANGSRFLAISATAYCSSSTVEICF